MSFVGCARHNIIRIPSFISTEKDFNFFTKSRCLLMFEKENLLSDQFFGWYEHNNPLAIAEIRLFIHESEISLRNVKAKPKIQIRLENDESEKIMVELHKRGWFHSYCILAKQNLSIIFRELKNQYNLPFLRVVERKILGGNTNFYEISTREGEEAVAYAVLYLGFLYLSSEKWKVVECENSVSVVTNGDEWREKCIMKFKIRERDFGKNPEIFEKNLMEAHIENEIIKLFVVPLLIAEANLCDEILSFFDGKENLATLLIENVLKEHTLLLLRRSLHSK